MKYLLSHRTSYTYASTVDSAQHIAHLRARAFPGQTVSSITIETNPIPALAVQHHPGAVHAGGQAAQSRALVGCQPPHFPRNSPIGASDSM